MIFFLKKLSPGTCTKMYHIMNYHTHTHTHNHIHTYIYIFTYMCLYTYAQHILEGYPGGRAWLIMSRLKNCGRKETYFSLQYPLLELVLPSICIAYLNIKYYVILQCSLQTKYLSSYPLNYKENNPKQTCHFNLQDCYLAHMSAGFLVV